VQEGAGVTFDIEYPTSEFAGTELVILFGVALVGYGVFRGPGWLLRHYRKQFPWRRLRVWWPLLSTAWVGATWFALRNAPSEGIGLILLAGPAWCFTVLNLPATMLAVLVLNLLDGILSVWLREGCALVVYCAGGYGWIRLLEWVAWRNEAVSLSLLGPEKSD